MFLTAIDASRGLGIGEEGLDMANVDKDARLDQARTNFRAVKLGRGATKPLLLYTNFVAYCDVLLTATSCRLVTGRHSSGLRNRDRRTLKPSVRRPCWG